VTSTSPTPGPVRAAGGVIVRSGPHGAWTVVVVHRPHRGDWTFPKGKVEVGEELGDCALREVLEETGLTCRAGAHVGRTEYEDYRGRPKLVDYWEMEVVGGSFQPNEEVDELRWVPIEDAVGILSYERDRLLLANLVGDPGHSWGPEASS